MYEKVCKTCKHWEQGWCRNVRSKYHGMPIGWSNGCDKHESDPETTKHTSTDRA